jgi:phosphoglycolate phosphatase (TIGR01487 family)
VYNEQKTSARTPWWAIVIVKAFAVDVDGTLTDRRSLLDLDAVSVLRQLEAKGIKTILTTGRNFSITRALVGFLGTCGLMIAENGGVVGVYPKTRIFLGDPSRSKEGLRVLREEFGEESVSLLDVACRLVDVVLEPRFDLKSANDVLARKNVRARIVYSGVAYHILDSDVNKGTGLRQICKIGDIELDSVVAVGDNYNDVEMLESAGYGIAVANAPDELKDLADFVCTKESGKGFVEAVNHVLSKFGSA